MRGNPTPIDFLIGAAERLLEMENNRQLNETARNDERRFATAQAQMAQEAVPDIAITLMLQYPEGRDLLNYFSRLADHLREYEEAGDKEVAQEVIKIYLRGLKTAIQTWQERRRTLEGK